MEWIWRRNAHVPGNEITGHCTRMRTQDSLQHLPIVSCLRGTSKRWKQHKLWWIQVPQAWPGLDHGLVARLLAPCLLRPNTPGPFRGTTVWLASAEHHRN